MDNVPGMFGLGGKDSKEDKKQVLQGPFIGRECEIMYLLTTIATQMLMQTVQQQQNIENARVLIEVGLHSPATMLPLLDG